MTLTRHEGHAETACCVQLAVVAPHLPFESWGDHQHVSSLVGWESASEHRASGVYITVHTQVHVCTEPQECAHSAYTQVHVCTEPQECTYSAYTQVHVFTEPQKCAHSAYTQVHVCTEPQECAHSAFTQVHVC